MSISTVNSNRRADLAGDSGSVKSEFGGDLRTSSIQRLPESDKEMFPEVKQLTDRSLARLEPHLFNFADQLTLAHKSHAFSAVIVDDCSARFLGIFLAKVIDQDGRLPLSFVRIPSSVREEEPENLKIELQIRAQKKEFGNNPLFVTDYIQTGLYCRYLVGTLVQQGIAPSVATLCYDKTAGGLDEVRRAGATQIFAHTNQPGVLGSVYRNNHINGVVENRQNQDAQWSWQRVKSWKSAQPHCNHILLSEPLRHVVVSYSRERMAEMVDRYKQARFQARMAAHSHQGVAGESLSML